MLFDCLVVKLVNESMRYIVVSFLVTCESRWGVSMKYVSKLVMNPSVFSMINIFMEIWITLVFMFLPYKLCSR